MYCIRPSVSLLIINCRKYNLKFSQKRKRPRREISKTSWSSVSLRHLFYVLGTTLGLQLGNSLLLEVVLEQKHSSEKKLWK